jgi:hypothetical protein
MNGLILDKMAKIDEIQTRFNAGELSPNIDGIVDFEPFFNGGSIIENFDVHPQGWLFRRKGTNFVNEVKDSTKKTRIIRFKYSTDQVLIIELGAGYFRFYSQQALVLSGGNAYEVVNSFTENDLDYIRYIQKDDVIWMVHPLKGIYKLIRFSNNDWSFNQIDLLYGPYQKENVIQAKTVSINNHGAVGTTGTMTASGHTPFTANHVGSLWLVKDGTAYAYLKITSFTSSTSVGYTSQSSIPTSFASKALYTWSEGEFGLHRSYPRAITFHEQRLVLAGSINEPQKIWFSKSADFENFDIDYNAMTVDDSFNRTIASSTNDSILWLFSDEVLFIGCTDSVWRAKASNNSAGMSNTDIDLKRQIAFGCEWVDPVYCDSTPFYLQRGKQKVRGIDYTNTEAKYKARDITIRSDHITGAGLKRFDYQQNPVSTIWAIRDDGQVAKFVFESDQEVNCWTRFTTNGIVEDIAIIPSTKEYDEVYFLVKRTINGTTKRFIEVLEPNFSYNNLNYIYLDSCLTYNGTQSTTLTIGSGIATAGSAVFSASSVGKEIRNLNGTGKAKITTYNSTTEVAITIIRDFSTNNLISGNWAIAIQEVGGLSHLIGASVEANGDGATDPDAKTVNAEGKITLKNFASIIHVGLKYNSIFTSYPIESKKLLQVVGSQQNKLLRITELAIKFFTSRAGLIEIDNKQLPIISRNLTDNINEAPTFKDGLKIITVAGDWGYDRKYSIIQNEPQAMNIKNITYEVNN